MTIGVGMQCREGVLLMTDSVVLHTNEFVQFSTRGERKIDWLEASRTAVIVSGTGDQALLRQRRVERDFQTAVLRFFVDVVELEQKIRSKYSPARQWYLFDRRPGFPQMLAAGGPGPRPQLACLTTMEAKWAALDEPAIYAIGNWTWAWLGPHNLLPSQAPPTLAGCEALAVSLARAFIDFVYQGQTFEEIVQTDIVGVAAPLSLVAFSDEGIQQKEIAIP